MSDDFTSSFDALDWAKAFVDIAREKPELSSDCDGMLGWFANAIMRGWDERERRLRQQIGEAAIDGLADGTMVVVPREPTQAMVDAHFQAHATADAFFADVPVVWRAMLDAARPATQKETQDG